MQRTKTESNRQNREKTQTEYTTDRETRGQTKRAIRIGEIDIQNGHRQRQRDRQTYRQKPDSQTDRQTDKRTDSQTDRETERQTIERLSNCRKEQDGQTRDVKTDRQTDR